MRLYEGLKSPFSLHGVPNYQKLHLKCEARYAIIRERVALPFSQVRQPKKQLWRYAE